MYQLWCPPVMSLAPIQTFLDFLASRQREVRGSGVTQTQVQILAQSLTLLLSYVDIPRSNFRICKKSIKTVST